MAPDCVVSGVTVESRAAWVQQAGRNLPDCYDGFLRDTRYILIDRDQKFMPFRGVLEGSRAEPVVLPPQSPNLNAHLKRSMRSMKFECLERLIFFGERSLRNALTEFLAHYHGERNHQDLGNAIIESDESVGRAICKITRRDRLGGMLRYCYRDAG